MKCFCSSADVANIEMKREFTYDSTTVLNLCIAYPEITLPNKAGQNTINSTYQNMATCFYNYCKDCLLPSAKTLYCQAMEDSFPFHPFDCVMQYEVTLNAGCAICCFFDRYIYTGGAHGNTHRCGSNRSLQTGAPIRLRNLFPSGVSYSTVILDQIYKQADANYAANPGIYFENYRELILQCFNPCSFYLSPEAINVFYQQYEIAPYSTGIVVFPVTYDSLGISPPRCI